MVILLPPLLSTNGFLTCRSDVVACMVTFLALLLSANDVCDRRSNTTACTKGVGVCVKAGMMVMDEVILWKTQSSLELK